MQYWKAHYKDALHDTDIQIVSTEGVYSTDPLSFTLDNIRFHGTSLGDFQLRMRDSIRRRQRNSVC